MRWRGVIICGLLSLAAGGCERRIPNSELGTVVFDLPKVPGAEKRPPTPGLDNLPPPKDAPSSKQGDSRDPADISEPPKDSAAGLNSAEPVDVP
jgi:hypothetical protein